ncbi:hypothetical protein [Eikenella longinqua]|uniref:hypothetical protein n=1 Tax=Eikenella longinqua TaxID=1795827 RepID=UPI0012E90394|nr:hypothetical protein [Eikenella longinqua]
MRKLDIFTTFPLVFGFFSFKAAVVSGFLLVVLVDAAQRFSAWKDQMRHNPADCGQRAYNTAFRFSLHRSLYFQVASP